MRRFAHPNDASGEPAVLVVFVSFGVARTLAEHLLDSCTVTFARAPAAAEALAGAGRHDVVVLCPYLSPAERARLLAAAGRRRPRPAVLELVDDAAGERTVAGIAADAAWMRSHARADYEPVLDALLAAAA
jgi:hypothetical protein